MQEEMQIGTIQYMVDCPLIELKNERRITVEAMKILERFGSEAFRVDPPQSPLRRGDFGGYRSEITVGWGRRC